MANRGNRRGKRQGGKKQGGGGKDVSKRRQNALEDVQIQVQPELNAIDRAEQQARGDYEDFGSQAEGIYDALRNELQGAAGQYQPQVDAISSGLTTRLSDLANQIGLSSMDTPGGETAAALGAYGSIGAGGLSQLSSDALRNASYGTSAQRQGAIEREEVQRNLLQDLKDTLDGLQERELQVNEGMGPLIHQRMRELSDEAVTRRLAHSQMASDEALSQYLQDSIGGMLGGGGGGGRYGPRGGGGGNGGPNVPPPHDAGPGFGSNGQSEDVGHHDPVRDWMGSGEGTPVTRKVRRINAMDDFGDLPDWLRSIYNLPSSIKGPEVWQYVQSNFGPRQRQIWRQTRPHARDLYQELYQL